MLAGSSSIVVLFQSHLLREHVATFPGQPPLTDDVSIPSAQGTRRDAVRFEGENPQI